MGRFSSHVLFDGSWRPADRPEQSPVEALLDVYDSDSAVLEAPGVWKLALGESDNASSDIAKCVSWARQRGTSITINALSDLLKRAQAEVFIEDSVVELLRLLNIEAPDEMT